MRNKSVGVGVANTNSIAEDVTKSIIMVMVMSEKLVLLIIVIVFACIIGYWDCKCPNIMVIDDE